MTVAAASKWDSDVFGVRVGVLASDRREPVQAIMEENRDLFDVVFVKSGGWVDPGLGAVAVDHLHDMEVRMPPIWPGGHSGKVRQSPASARHAEIARTAFVDSRFLRDWRLCERAPEMYARWVSGKTAWVLDARPDDAFLLVSGDADGARRVSLVAVDGAARGSGLGESLLSGVFVAEPPSTWRVMVSARNAGAIRFYENSGFRVRESRTAFHVWTAGGMA